MRLAIVGASVRAAAFSALAAGFDVVAADLFADADLSEVCPTHVVHPWPEGIADWLASQRVDAWMYTGGIENHPQLVARLAEIAPLWGTPAATLALLRDPFYLQGECSHRGIRFPETQPNYPAGQGSGWLRKRTNTAGGLGVSHAGTEARLATTQDQVVYQKLIEGAVEWAALFAVSAKRADLLGITGQLVGEPWTGAAEFRYCGSVTSEPPPGILECCQRVGELLVDAGALGVVGVDLLNRDSEWWLCEINPRYTASAEIVERSLDAPVVALHRAVCTGAEPRLTVVPCAAGKAILFAEEAITISQSASDWMMTRRLAAGGFLADIPPAGSTIPAGGPVLTAIAVGESDVRGELRLRLDEVRAQLAASPLVT